MRLLPALAALAVAGSALAQDTGDDWDVLVDPARSLTAASLTFSSGVSVGMRCVNGRYDAFLAGLPPPPEGQDIRALSIQLGNKPASEQDWMVATNPRVAVSIVPAMFARSMREGGPMQVTVPGAGAGGANLRFLLDLPASSTAIDQTLEACNRPLVDARDAGVEPLGPEGLPSNITWIDLPRPTYPMTTPSYAKGFAVISCLTQADGTLRDCAIESQHPLDGGFGESALRATRRGRVGLVDNPGAPMPTRFTIFRVNYRTPDPNRQRTGTRLGRN